MYTDPVHTAQQTLSVSTIKTSHLMLYRGKKSCFSQIHTKHKYTAWAESSIMNVEPGGTYSNHWTLKG